MYFVNYTQTWMSRNACLSIQGEKMIAKSRVQSGLFMMNETSSANM